MLYATLRSVFGDQMITTHVGMPCFAMDWSFRVAAPRPLDLSRLERNFEAAVKAGMQLDAFHPCPRRLRSGFPPAKPQA